MCDALSASCIDSFHFSGTPETGRRSWAAATLVSVRSTLGLGRHRQQVLVSSSLWRIGKSGKNKLFCDALVRVGSLGHPVRASKLRWYAHVCSVDGDRTCL